MFDKIKKNRFVIWIAFQFHMHIGTLCTGCKVAVIYTCLAKSHDESRFSQECKINAL